MFVLATGMATSIGLTGAATAAAFRARLNRFSEHPFHDDTGEPIIGAAAREITGGVAGVPRHAALLAHALRECIAADPRVPTERTALLVALPEPGRAGRPDQLDERLLRIVELDLGARFSPRSRALPLGRAGGLAALAEARAALREGEVPRCIVAGVDSLLDVRDLESAQRARRLKTSSNSDGFIPGEAAAAVMLAGAPGSAGGPAVRVAGLGIARETSPITSEEPCRADGLTEALRAALRDGGVAMRDIAFRMADIAGERYEFREQALAMLRVLRDRKEEFPLWLPASSLGEVGAAAGPCMVALASHAFRRGYAPGPAALVFGASDSGLRAVAILRSEGPMKHG